MKKKNKVKFSVKIKNYLQSLSKWAKEHIKGLLFGICAILLVISVFTSGCRASKTTACAMSSSIEGTSDVLVLPSTIAKSNVVCLTVPIYIGLNDNQELTVLYVDNRAPVNYSPSNMVFTKSSDFEYSLSGLCLGGIYYGSTMCSGLPLTTLVNDVYLSTFSYEFVANNYLTNIVDQWAYIKSHAEYIIATCLNHTITWTIVGNNLPICTFWFFSERVSSSEELRSEYGINITWLARAVVDNQYQQGYDDGYYQGDIDGYNRGYNEGKNIGKTEGFDEGYKKGYDEGLLDGDGFDLGYDEGYKDGDEYGYNRGYNRGYKEGEDYGYNRGLEDNPNSFNVFRPFANGVVTLINADIFGNFSIADMFSLAMSLVLFGYCIKLFLGG